MIYNSSMHFLKVSYRCIVCIIWIIYDDYGVILTIAQNRNLISRYLQIYKTISDMSNTTKMFNLVVGWMSIKRNETMLQLFYRKDRSEEVFITYFVPIHMNIEHYKRSTLCINWTRWYNKKKGKNALPNLIIL